MTAAASVSNTIGDFFRQVLGGLGITPSAGDLAALASVAHYEGLNDRYNPLNSVVPYGTSTKFNSVGVQDYQTFDQGVQGSIKLLNGSPWRKVVAALRGGNEQSVLSAFDTEYQTWGSAGPSAAGSGTVSSVLATSAGAGGPLPTQIGNMNGTGATTGVGSASDASAVSGALGIGNPLNPASWVSSIMNTLIKMGFTVGGVTVVVLGLYRAAQPARQSIEQKAAPLAAAVA